VVRHMPTALLTTFAEHQTDSYAIQFWMLFRDINPDVLLPILRAVKSGMQHLEAGLAQQGTPGSSATRSPTLSRCTFSPTSTMVLQNGRNNPKVNTLSTQCNGYALRILISKEATWCTHVESSPLNRRRLVRNSQGLNNRDILGRAQDTHPADSWPITMGSVRTKSAIRPCDNHNAASTTQQLRCRYKCEYKTCP
jgi:hypothetical protein